MMLLGEPILHGLRSSGISLFEDGGPRIDPDIIVQNAASITAVFDAKYKSLDPGSSGTAADLYQLTSYVRRLSAKLGALVYFSDGPATVSVSGTTPEGAPILVISISADLLLSEETNALTRLLSHSPTLNERLKQCFANGLCHKRGDSVSDLPSNVLLGAQELEVVGK